MINNAYAKLNRTIKRDIAKKVKELIKENKNNEYYELYVVYDKVNNSRYVSLLAYPTTWYTYHKVSDGISQFSWEQ